MNAYLKQNCDKCRYLCEIVGGDELVPWCNVKDEYIHYPTITGVFCKSFKEVEEDEQENGSV